MHGKVNSESDSDDVVMVEWFPCPEINCESKFQYNDNLKWHLMFYHDIGVEWIPCTEASCDRKFKFDDNLQNHLLRVHNNIVA